MNNNFAITLKNSLEGQSLTKLATALNIPKSLLHDWIYGRRSPSMANLHHVRSLAQYIGISFEELIFGEISTESKTLTTVAFSDNGNQYSITISKLKETRNGP